MATPPGTARHFAGPAGHSRTPGCRLGLPSLCLQPCVQPSALPPKHFPNPIASLYLRGHQPSPLCPPASTLASCCHPPPAICSLGSKEDIFKIANHIRSLSKLAWGLWVINLRAKPISVPTAPQGPAPGTSHQYLASSVLSHLPQIHPPLHCSSNMSSLFLLQDLCSCSSFPLSPHPS